MPLTSGVPSTKSDAPVCGASVKTKPAGPDVSSITVTSTETGTSLPFGGQSVDGVGVHASVGGVASRAIVNDALDRPPRFVAVHVRVVPAVPSVSVTLSQPLLEVIGDAIASTLQLTVTSPTYQPGVPSAPTTC